MVGDGPGLGRNINIAWNGGGGFNDADYLYAFQRLIMPICYEFAPDLVLGRSPTSCPSMVWLTISTPSPQSRLDSTLPGETCWEDAMSPRQATPTCCICCLGSQAARSWSRSRFALFH